MLDWGKFRNDFMRCYFICEVFVVLKVFWEVYIICFKLILNF